MARSHLAARGINFRSLSDPIDTTSAGGRLVLGTAAISASSTLEMDNGLFCGADIPI